jgi:hypothetical protein
VVAVYPPGFKTGFGDIVPYGTIYIFKTDAGYPCYRA